MSPFEPTGDVAKWRIIYGLLVSVEPGEILTYAEMQKALGLKGPKSRHAIQMAMRRAGAELERVNKHAVRAIKNVGYLVEIPDQHVALARIHQTKAVRSVKRAKSKTDNVDYNQLSPDLVLLAEATSAALGMQLEYIRRIDVRQQQLADSLAAVKENQTRSREDIDKLKARLSALEQGQP